MEKIIDLHTHSTASDGSMSPAELVRHAKAIGLAAIALTDHDTVDGVEEAINEGKRSGIEVIPGIEISVRYKPEMHILGLFPDCDKYINIRSELYVVKKGRQDRNRKIINRLNELGIEITEDEVKNVAMGDITGRPHIARVLVAKEYVKNINEAFDIYLSKDGLAYFQRFELEPADGIKAIRKSGGIPVIAHPVFLRKNYNEMDELLGELKGYGLAGIEAYYSENTKEDTGNFLRLAIKHGLVVTGGSDFHGIFKPGIELGHGSGGLKVPYELLDKLREFQNNMNK
ncbi:PHP domain-containing protein [Ruminiclostridium cellulolyticum]|uniref:PHP domain protein n=1 Tax=Ruminiclostridium cellulolyticum (strain ATCC 35319 / DSM 5812 / JCM 6584 / H10) TaxID=394503 RepID=B8I8G3_RUMCH|nr:PHP domain-containing protein [Ruminiclostridium cellulolyticum]ACL75196.1 PHP domain protein [Ruminiclostridium cellulolyticum H10]